jgi:outer membrane protein assembly factor BamD (BamD/ComL family)
MKVMADRPMRRIALLVIAVAGLASASGCQTSRAIKSKFANWRPFASSYDDPHADEKMARAQDMFDRGLYAKAHTIFKDLADNTGNSATLAEHARFMQAECCRIRGHYPDAVDTYHRLLMDHPTGVHRTETCIKIFEICDYWLDDFRDDLVRRQGEKGVLHWRPRWPHPLDHTKPVFVQESRAVEALEYVHTFDFSGPLADKSLFWCGYVNFIRGNFDEADQFFSQLIELHKDSPLRPQAIAYAIQAKNNATGGAVYDGRKCAEALHLVQVAEASVPELTNNPDMAEKLNRSKIAIRYQQAEKDFRTAEYYERTGHPGSAIFYYELTRRRYPNTRYSEVAAGRKEQLKAMMESGKPPTGRDPIVILQAKWKEVFGSKKGVVTADGEEPSGPLGPSGIDPRSMPSFGPPGGMGGMGGMGPAGGPGGYQIR